VFIDRVLSRRLWPLRLFEPTRVLFRHAWRWSV